MKQLATILMTIVCGAILIGFWGWVFWSFLKRSEDPVRLLVKWGITLGLFITLGVISGSIGVSPILVPIAAVFGIILAIVWGRSIGEMIAKPFANMFDGGAPDAVRTPFYSIVEARRKRGEYAEAVAEVMKQLEQFPGDFHGWMLLAEIQAENQQDIASAMETLEHVLSLPEPPPKNIAFALNRAADWELKLRKDPAAAVRALERIVALLPDTEQAQVTLQRIAQITHAPLPRQSTEPVRIAVPTFERRMGLKQPATTEAEPTDTSAELAAGYLQRLQEMPEDNEAREKLAVLYAEHFKRLELAEQELEQLITAPNQPPKQVVHWLNLLADLQMKHSDDTERVRQTVQRIIDLYPDGAAAENAMHRLAYLNLEVRGKQKSQAVKLGSYEKNLGLK